MPRVSVIMPVYNAAPFLRGSVESILTQTFQDFELIAVDDGSSDESWEVLQAFSDKRLRTFRFKHNCGAGLARNYAVKRADGEYLAFLDADDLAAPSRLDVQVACLQSRPEIGVVASRAWILYSGGITKQWFESLRPDEISATLVFRNCLVQSSVLMRHDRWQPLRSEYEAAWDYDLWARLTPEVKFILLKQALVTYREHEGGISKRKPDQLARAVRQILRFQLERLGVRPKLDLHLQLTSWPADASAEQLAETELWLRELLRANRIYDPPSFQSVAERVWFRICLDSWSLGPRAFHIYRRSPLARLTPSKIARFFRRFGRRALTGR